MKYFGITLCFVIITTILWNSISKKQYLSAVGSVFVAFCCGVFGYFLVDTRFNFSAAFTKTIELFIVLGVYILFVAGGIFAIWFIIYTFIRGRRSRSSDEDDEIHIIIKRK